jgi:hypothetical protein
LNIGVSRNRFCDFLADPDSRSFSRFGAIIMQFAVFQWLRHRFYQDMLGTSISTRGEPAKGTRFSRSADG